MKKSVMNGRMIKLGSRSKKRTEVYEHLLHRGSEDIKKKYWRANVAVKIGEKMNRKEKN